MLRLPKIVPEVSIEGDRIAFKIGDKKVHIQRNRVGVFLRQPEEVIVSKFREAFQTLIDVERTKESVRNLIAQTMQLESRSVVEDDVEMLIMRQMREPTGYQILTPIYVKEVEETRPTGALIKKAMWKMYMGRFHPESDSDIILDMNGYINPKLTEITVVTEDDVNFIAQICSQISAKGRRAVENIVYERIERPKPKEITPPLPQQIAALGILKKPIPRIKDLTCLNEIGDWSEFVESLVEYKCRKDDAVKLFLKKDILRGINPRLNPNSIIAKNPGVGVTEFYHQHCLHIGKATKNSFIGFAKSPVEIYPGTIHEQDIAIAIDQVESQDAVDIFGYLFDVAEQGSTNVSSGGVKFPVTSNSKIAFIANVQPSEDPTTSFRYLLGHIAFNLPAFLKRIGVLLHNDRLEPVREIQTSDMTGLKRRGQFFRAIEEIAFPALRSYYYDDEVWKWSQRPLGNYQNEVWEIISTITDAKVKVPFYEHSKGAQPRIKGAGLNIALTEKLSDIAQKHNLNLQTDILIPAEEYAYQFVEMNKASITRIANTWEEQRDDLARSVFDTILPNYIKEVVLAVEHYRQMCATAKTQLPIELPASVLGHNYQCRYHQYFIQAVNQVRYVKYSIQKNNQYLRNYYGFELLRKENNEICVRFL